MNIYFTKIKHFSLLVFICSVSSVSFGQIETSKWKAQISFGFNYPDVDGFVTGFEAKPVNFPTINLGIQHMFTQSIGGKLDFGYNRFSNTESSVEFKTNYTRINVQFVYDAIKKIRFLPPSIGLVGHFGPGISIITPLGNYGDNKHSFFNTMAGVEFHYRIAKTVSVYVDGSYIMSFSGDKTYNPVTKGYGAFNNNLFNITLGVSVSLSGCQYCD